MQHEVEKAWGAWLNQYRWDWFVTLTFKNPVTKRQAFQRFNRWKLQLKKASGSCIYYIMVMEDHKYRGSIPHLHLLLSGVRQEKPREWQRKWYLTNGLGKIKRYNPQLGASYYIGEKLADKGVEVIFSKGFRRLPS